MSIQVTSVVNVMPPGTTEGYKNDLGKLRYDLILPWAMQDLAEVFTYGALKYKDHNWTGGIKWSRIFAATLRHLMAFWMGEDLDPESGLKHTAHAMWGCYVLCHYQWFKRNFDDRWKPNEGGTE